MSFSTLQEIYRHLHSIAEPGFKEFSTAVFLADELRAAGYDVQEQIGGTGVVGTLKADGSPTFTVALLADMDALVHRIDGKDTVVHSCGHDANCAMVLGAARILAKKRLPCTLKILFQPAEEKLCGAKAMIESGAAAGIDVLIGLHLRSTHEARLHQCTPSLDHCAACSVDITVAGKAAHGARPHLGCNAIDAGTAIVMAVNAIHLDPTHSFSAKVTRFQAGGPSTNIIPDRADLTVDVRTDSDDDMELLLGRIYQAAQFGASSIGAEVSIATRGLSPASSNDAGLKAVAESAVIDVLGAENLLPAIRTAGGDDFHFFAKLVPGLRSIYLGLGADLTPGLHDPCMSFDLNALDDGQNILVRLAQLVAEQQEKFSSKA